MRLRMLAPLAMALVLGLALPGSGRAADPAAGAPQAPAPGPAIDTIVVLVSDTSFGPDMEDADKAARYYCSAHGKLSELVSKERPPEFRSDVLQAWSILTYRCYVPGSGR